ncbi:hypothetical protein [Shinella sp. DD12]|uniref:hypothetical protein n=1 Tax=Shinella sp. DD12 TaxID=1410620 RepID=UPI0003C5333B|nr:hypothetical protein [Shinella sp. DD12]EYR83077.1 hypothetical protein SHLA_68c000330 [Shinella sp. DD12]
MQRFLFLLFFTLPAAAFAQGWEPYANARFGFAVDVPPGFTLVQEADNGDGRTYANGEAKLSVWANHLVIGSFADEVASRRMAYLREGWDLSYERQAAGWASLSGTLVDSILYHRIIALCDEAAASFVLEYPQSMKAEMSPLIGKPVKSLRPAEGCTSAQGTAPPAQ